MKDLIERFEAFYDSSWLPEEMLEIYSPVECLADNPQCTTLLLRSRTGADMSVAKCYSKDSVMVSVTEDDILSSISHDGLPDYVGRYENDRTVCVVRKYIEGKTFDSVIRGKKFTPEETASFALKICDILEYLHSRPQPVLHRDIKPGNIVVDAEDNVYLIDFGISRLLRDTEKKDTKIAATASYAPPEQFGFLPTDARSDIYALGVVLNEMLTGSTQLSGGTSGGMGRIVSKCTAFSPDDRYRSARQLKKEISRWRYRHLRRAAAVLATAIAVPLMVFLCGILARSKPQPAAPPMQEISAYSFEPETGILTLSDGAKLSEELEGITDDTSLYKVTELVLGEGVSGVDRESCGGFTGLKRLTIPASVYESMNGDEFNGADRLVRITVLPDEESGVGWTYDRTNRTLELSYSGIGTGVVKGENFWHKLECIDRTWIRYVSVGEGVTGLGFNMLWDHRSLESIELPRSLVMLDSSNFADTPSLVSVTVHPENQYFRSVDGVLFGRDDSSDSTDPSEKLFFVPRDRTGRFSVPSGTKTLGSFSFADCTGITEIAFPESLSVIEGSAFVKADSLNGFDLSENSRMSIDAESGILYAESARLEDNGDVFTVMEIIYAPPTVSGHYRVPRNYDNVIIHDSAFRNCSELTEITLPENVVHIGDGAFHSCKSLKKVNLPADMAAVFSRLPEHYSSEYLGYEAFARSGITSVRIPYGVTHIIDYCFYGCSALSEVYIPDTVETVEGSTFGECSALKNIYRTDKTGAVIPHGDDGVHPEQ